MVRERPGVGERRSLVHARDGRGEAYLCADEDGAAAGEGAGRGGGVELVAADVHGFPLHAQGAVEVGRGQSRIGGAIVAARRGGEEVEVA